MALSGHIYGQMWGMGKNRRLYRVSGKGLDQKNRLCLAALCLVFLLNGCASLHDPETSQEFNGDIVATLEPGHSVGQTLISRRPRFDGITLWLGTETPGAILSLTLFHSPSDLVPILTTTVKISETKTQVDFDPQNDPTNQGYYLRLTTTQGEINIFGRDEDVYLSGQAFVDELPITGDVAFRASYDYDWRAMLADVGTLLGNWWLVLPLGVLLFFPGWLILEIGDIRKEFEVGEQIALAVGLSIAIPPVLMLWTTQLGMSWNWVAVLVVAGFILIAFGWRLGVKVKHQGGIHKLPNLLSRFQLTPVVLVVLFGSVLFVRFAMARDLLMPSWVDSIHHSLITKSIVQAGGFPKVGVTHLPEEASQYHPGFHSLLATFHWLSGIEIPEAMLILGQVLNAASVLGVYLITTTLIKNQRAGLIAALIAGLFTVMPAYYTSWGRYTQLAGLLVLPAGLRFVSTSERTKHKLLVILLGGFTLAGLFIVHYRVTLFLGCLILAYWLGNIYRPAKDTLFRLGSSIKSTVFMGIFSLCLTLPWLIATLKIYLPLFAPNWSGSNTAFEGINWGYLTPALGIPAMVTAGVGFVWGIFKRQRFTITLLVWGLLLFGIANPRFFRLPFPAGAVNQTSVDIILFIPIAVLGGYVICEVTSWFEQHVPEHRKWIFCLTELVVGVGLSILGAQKLLPTLNPDTVLWREADQTAIKWLQANVPEHETIVINPTGWGYGLYRGADGGYWISMLTNQATLPPNVLYGLDAQERDYVNQFVEELLPIGENPTEIKELLENHELSIIFIGQRGGVISPKSLSESPFFETLYHDEEAWIFKTKESQ
jgi:hypothetical protein